MCEPLTWTNNGFSWPKTKLKHETDPAWDPVWCPHIQTWDPKIRLGLSPSSSNILYRFIGCLWTSRPGWIFFIYWTSWVVSGPNGALESTLPVQKQLGLTGTMLPEDNYYSDLCFIRLVLYPKLMHWVVSPVWNNHVGRYICELWNKNTKPSIQPLKPTNTHQNRTLSSSVPGWFR